MKKWFLTTALALATTFYLPQTSLSQEVNILKIKKQTFLESNLLQKTVGIPDILLDNKKPTRENPELEEAIISEDKAILHYKVSEEKTEKTTFPVKKDYLKKVESAIKLQKDDNKRIARSYGRDSEGSGIIGYSVGAGANIEFSHTKFNQKYSRTYKGLIGTKYQELRVNQSLEGKKGEIFLKSGKDFRESDLVKSGIRTIISSGNLDTITELSYRKVGKEKGSFGKIGLSGENFGAIAFHNGSFGSKVYFSPGNSQMTEMMIEYDSDNPNGNTPLVSVFHPYLFSLGYEENHINTEVAFKPFNFLGFFGGIGMPWHEYEPHIGLILGGGKYPSVNISVSNENTYFDIKAPAKETFDRAKQFYRK